MQNDNGYYVKMVLIDLQTVFDTVDYSILHVTLKYLGLSWDTLNWLKTYIHVSDRKQLVDISGVLY